MIALKIPANQISLKNRIKLLFGSLNGVVLSIPNITLEKKESIILHSFEGKETTVGIMANEDGSLRVLFSTPSTHHDYIDVSDGMLDIEPELRKRIEGK